MWLAEKGWQNYHHFLIQDWSPLMSPDSLTAQVALH